MFEQRSDLVLHTLAAPRADQHVDIGAGDRLITCAHSSALWPHELYYEQPCGWFHCAAAVLKNPHAIVIVPVVKHVLEEVNIRNRDLLEEVACDAFGAAGQPDIRKPFSRTF